MAASEEGGKVGEGRGDDGDDGGGSSDDNDDVGWDNLWCQDEESYFTKPVKVPDVVPGLWIGDFPAPASRRFDALATGSVALVTEILSVSLPALSSNEECTSIPLSFTSAHHHL